MKSIAKPSKPINSSTLSKKTPRPSSPEDAGLEQLRDLQRSIAQALFRPLAPGDRMQREWVDGRPMREAAAEWIKPNDRLTSFDRLEIYNRCYWFRVLDCLYDDYPGLRAVLGIRKFQRLSRAYLERFPSASFTLRDLGSRLEGFLREEPHWAAPHEALAIDMAQFEWAQVVAFDGPALPPLLVDDLLGSDPATLRLGLQPYLSLLDLRYPVDAFAIAVKSSADDGLRDQASNTMDAAPKTRRRSRVRLPGPEAVPLAVHRHENMIYFKRLAAEEFTLLRALRGGATLEEACGIALESYLGRSAEFPEKVRAWFETAAMLGWFCNSAAARKAGHS